MRSYLKMMFGSLLFVGLTDWAAAADYRWVARPTSGDRAPDDPKISLSGNNNVAVVETGNDNDNFIRRAAGNMRGLQIGANGDIAADPINVGNIEAKGLLLGRFGDNTTEANGYVQIGGNGATFATGRVGTAQNIDLEHGASVAGSLMVQVGGNAGSGGQNSGGDGSVSGNVILTVMNNTMRNVNLAVTLGGRGNGGTGQIDGNVTMDNQGTGNNSLSVNNRSSLGGGGSIITLTTTSGNNTVYFNGNVDPAINTIDVVDIILGNANGDNSLTNTTRVIASGALSFTTNRGNNMLLNQGTLQAASLRLGGTGNGATTGNNEFRTSGNATFASTSDSLVMRGNNNLLEINSQARTTDEKVTLSATQVILEATDKNIVNVYGDKNTIAQIREAVVAGNVTLQGTQATHTVNMFGFSRIDGLDATGIGTATLTYNLGKNSGAKNPNDDYMQIKNLTMIGTTHTFNLYNGVFSTAQSLANNGMMNFAGGRINIADSDFIANADSTLSFNLSQYNAANYEGGKAIIDVSGNNAKVELQTGAVVKVEGGQHNRTYTLINTNAANGIKDNCEVVAQIRASSNFMYSYESKFQSNDQNLQITSVANSQTIINTATQTSSSNKGIAETLVKIANGGSEITEALSVIDGKDNTAFGRAVSELNDTNAKSATNQTGQAATQQFNNALAQVWSENRSNQLAAGFIKNGMKLSVSNGDAKTVANKKSAAAGGIPLDPITVAGCDYKWGGFAKAYGGFGAEQNTNAAAGYDFGGVGFLMGLDYKIAEEVRLGALFGYSYNRTELKQDLGNSTDNLLRLGLYGSYQWESLFVNTAPTFGIHLLETKRHFNALNNFGTALGKRTGFDFNWLNQVGYAFAFPAELIFTPSYSLALTFMHDPSYNETGSVANLQVANNNNWSLLQNIELKFGRVIRLNNKWAFLPEIWGAWEHEYLTTNDVSMRFATAPQQSWQSPIKQIAPDRGVFGVGLTTLLCDRYEFYGRWEQKVWDGGYSCNFAVGASVKF